MTDDSLIQQDEVLFLPHYLVCVSPNQDPEANNVYTISQQIVQLRYKLGVLAKLSKNSELFVHRLQPSFRSAALVQTTQL